MKNHPYAGLPDRQFWRRFVSDCPWGKLNLNEPTKFQLEWNDRIATAGSCFAQHISRHLRKHGIPPYLAEPPHPLISEYGGDVGSYELFSARYGNIYTARQLWELFEQAFGRREMIEDFTEENGRWYDLLRPSVQKQGYASISEARADREYHLLRVRELFENASVFIFTLGLTESWYNARSLHTYPACPGTVRGSYDPDCHRFQNASCGEVTQDLERLVDALSLINPGLKIILTVSPVPLVATFTRQNVLVASSYSKAVLRAAAGEIEGCHPNVAYFPSFEIISSPASFGQYLSSDLREVNERGVSHVMECFMAAFFNAGFQPVNPIVGVAEADCSSPSDNTSALVECDELMNARTSS
jgi:hypothetical protein